MASFGMKQVHKVKAVSSLRFTESDVCDCCASFTKSSSVTEPAIQHRYQCHSNFMCSLSQTNRKPGAWVCACQWMCQFLGVIALESNVPVRESSCQSACVFLSCWSCTSTCSRLRFWIRLPLANPIIPPPMAAATPTNLNPAIKPRGPPSTPPTSAPATGSTANPDLAAWEQRGGGELKIKKRI